MSIVHLVRVSAVTVLSAVALAGCSKAAPPRQHAAAPQPTLDPVHAPAVSLDAAEFASPVTAVLAKDVTPLTVDPALPAAGALSIRAEVVVGTPPEGAPALQTALRAVVESAREPGMPRLRDWLTEESLTRLQSLAAGAPLPVTQGVIAARFAGPLASVHFQGGRAAVVAKQPDGTALTSWWYLRDGAWRLDLTDSRPLLPPQAGPADTLNRSWPLAEVEAAVTGVGKLALRLHTSVGSVDCQLHTGLAPQSVAHVAALAAGLRGHRVVEGKTLTTRWEATPFYSAALAGTVYESDASHLAFGCPFGNGAGHAGFGIADELTMRLRHDKPGVLALAADAPNGASSRLSISLAPRPLRDDRDTIIGQCGQLEVLQRLRQQPLRDQRIERVEVVRLP